MSESEKTEKNGGVESQLPAGSDASALSGSISANANLNLSANVNLNFDALSLPGKKLLQTVGAYLGYAQGAVRAAEMKKMTEAQAHSMVALAEAYKRTVELVGVEKADEIKESFDFLALRQRAGGRVIQQEMKRQQNFESVASQAAQKLPEKVSEEPVKSDWMARLYEGVKDVSDEKMQALWSSVLAGEVTQPGGTSLRTLDVLKNLSRQDAEIFERLARRGIFGDKGFSAGVVFYPTVIDFPGAAGMTITEYILPYSNKIMLQECGLVHSESTWTFHNMDKRRISLDGFLFEIAPLGNSHAKVEIPIIQLTRPGREIARFIPAMGGRFPDAPYIRGFARFLERRAAMLRVVAKMPAPAMAGVAPANVSDIPTPSGEEGVIVSTMADDEIDRILLTCPRQAVLK